MTDFQKVFNHSLHQEAAAKKILTLRQGNQTVADFFIQFFIAAQVTEWDNSGLKSIFSLNALNDSLKDQLATRDDPDNLNEFIELAIFIDVQLRERKKEKNYNAHTPVASGFSIVPVPGTVSAHTPTKISEPEPMQIGHARLTPEERQRCFRARQCIYCGNCGHYIADFPLI